MELETEVKLRLSDASTGIALLQQHGFAVVSPRVFEVNLVFDTENLTLRTSDSLLRLREAGSQRVLTFKGPGLPGRHKSREELEIHVSDGGMATRILQRLGYQLCFRYEKFRTEFQRPDRGGIVMLDETPVGCFLELEGAPEWIDAIAKELGFDEPAYITASYGAIYMEECRSRSVTPTNMVFSEGEKTSL